MICLCCVWPRFMGLATTHEPPDFKRCQYLVLNKLINVQLLWFILDLGNLYFLKLKYIEARIFSYNFDIFLYIADIFSEVVCLALRLSYMWVTFFPHFLSAINQMRQSLFLTLNFGKKHATTRTS